MSTFPVHFCGMKRMMRSRWPSNWPSMSLSYSSSCEQLLRELELPIDIVVLGMGEDGHTASLFPDMPNLTEALSSEALLYVVARPESSDFPRISLSARVLASASMVILHITGQSKRNTLAQACQQKNAMNMPIWSIIKQKEINVYWSV